MTTKAAQAASKRAPRRRRISTLEDFYEHVALTGIKFNALWVQERDTEEEPDDEMHITAKSGASEDYCSWTVELTAATSGRRADYRVSVVARYTSEKPVDLTDDFRDELIASSSALTLAPYIREAIASLAARVEDDAPVLPLMGPQSMKRVHP